MKDFSFWNPTRVVFGKGTVTQIGAHTKEFGGKILLVAGQSSARKTGVYDQVLASLREAQLEIVEFSGVKSNPLLSHLRHGIALAKREAVEVVVAVGGGSVIDEGKAIAAGAGTDGDVWDFFVNRATIKGALPLLAVLTLAATGSEMNSGAVITNEATQQKFNIGSPYLFPKVSIMDPTVTFTVPRTYTAYSAVDAIAHVIEGYFTGADPWTPIQDGFVEALVLTIMESTERILTNPEDYEARATMMWAASLALNGLTTAGIGGYGFPNHMIGHSLSALYDVPHGAALSIVIPGWMQYAARSKPSKFARFAEKVFGISEASPESAAERGSQALKAWFTKIASPTTLAAVDIAGGDIDRIAENATMLAAKWKLSAYTRAVISEILACCQ
jgi:alcohol dehydrogenase YqhD (iron-dependent ADH family)